MHIRFYKQKSTKTKCSEKITSKIEEMHQEQNVRSESKYWLSLVILPKDQLIKNSVTISKT